MRCSSLFMAAIGAMPLAVFAVTMWLSEGAPFVPPHERMPAPAGPAGAVVDAVVNAARAGPDDPARARTGEPARTGTGDAEWDRLRRLAGRGDVEAALLLTILDGPRR